MPDLTFTPANQNPFATIHWERIPFLFQTGDWDFHLQRLSAMRYRAAIVGACGSGKSSLLRELAVRLTEIGKFSCVVDLPHERKEHSKAMEFAMEKCKAGAVLLLDGIERLNIRQRLELHRCSEAGLVFTCHRSPLISQTWIKCQTDSALMRYVIQTLGIEEHRILDSAEHVLNRNRGNIREALFELYRDYSVRES